MSASNADGSMSECVRSAASTPKTVASAQRGTPTSCPSAAEVVAASRSHVMGFPTGGGFSAFPSAPASSSSAFGSHTVVNTCAAADHARVSGFPSTLQQQSRDSQLPPSPAIAPADKSQAFRLNASAKPFQPSTGGISYEAAAREQQQQRMNSDAIHARANHNHHVSFAAEESNVVLSTADPADPHRDFGKILIPSRCTDSEQISRMLVGATCPDDDRSFSVGSVAEGSHGGWDEAGSEYSRGTSVRTHTKGAHEEDGDEEDFNEDFESDDLNHYHDAVDDLQGDDEDEDDDEDLSAEERAWLEQQCEAKDNPEGFFW